MLPPQNHPQERGNSSLLLPEAPDLHCLHLLAHGFPFHLLFKLRPLQQLRTVVGEPDQNVFILSIMFANSRQQTLQMKHCLFHMIAGGLSTHLQTHAYHDLVFLSSLEKHTIFPLLPSTKSICFRPQQCQICPAQSIKSTYSAHHHQLTFPQTEFPSLKRA